MLFKDIRSFTPEQSKAARVTAYRLPGTLDWTLYVNGDSVKNSRGEARTFGGLDAIVETLDAAGIDTLKLDLSFGKTGRTAETLPALDAMISFLETQSAATAA
ncbi:hypothetical protein QCE63_04920 [Caballeronia sp. LZ065]|uniref:hypothetical protein n=1 Tax=Caballeronia sp. LZ065 TaxID=3038571 RepID=UPI0028606A53|nr:hypothetical protein [Caballeronia sp. LZ065]MDR5778773.1 hypothetical protein [Caballeronia sp. LZ065]